MQTTKKSKKAYKKEEYPLLLEGDPFEEMSEHRSSDNQETMVMDQGDDSPALYYFTKLMREQVNPYNGIGTESNCALNFKNIFFQRDKIKLSLDVEHSTNPEDMIYVANMFASVGYDIEVYWNSIPGYRIDFKDNGDPVATNLLSVEKMYVSRIKDTAKFIKGGIVSHKINRNVSGNFSGQHRVKNDSGLSFCLLQ